jgi:hypothetical protein
MQIHHYMWGSSKFSINIQTLLLYGATSICSWNHWIKVEQELEKASTRLELVEASEKSADACYLGDLSRMEGLPVV